MRWLLTAILLLAACDQSTPLVGTPIGQFAVTGLLDTTASTTPRRCDITGSVDPVKFQAVLSYQPTGTGFWLTVDTTDPRPGTLTGGVSFDTFAPTNPPSSPNPGVERSIPACTDCRVTVVEEIRGNLFVEGDDPGEAKCTAPGGVPAPTPPATFDPTKVSAICGQVIDTLRFENTSDDPAKVCTCQEKGGPTAGVQETDGPGTNASSKDCEIVYWYHGPRS